MNIPSNLSLSRRKRGEKTFRSERRLIKYWQWASTCSRHSIGLHSPVTTHKWQFRGTNDTKRWSSRARHLTPSSDKLSCLLLMPLLPKTIKISRFNYPKNRRICLWNNWRRLRASISHFAPFAAPGCNNNFKHEIIRELICAEANVIDAHLRERSDSEQHLAAIKPAIAFKPNEACRRPCDGILRSSGSNKEIMFRFIYLFSQSGPFRRIVWIRHEQLCHNP